MSTSRRRVLVIDDDDSVRDVLSDFLTVLGYEVELASTAIEGLGIIAVRRPDVVLLDLRMPGVHGTAVVGTISKEAPVIVLTGEIDPDLRQQTLGDGASGFATKPFDFAELRELIETAIRR